MDEDKNKVVTGHIYILLFPSGKRYVGQTIQTVEKRMRRHWRPSKKEYSYPVHNAMRCYGKKDTIIEKTFTLKCAQEYLDLIEIRAIKHYNTLAPNGYNLTEGGRGGAKSKEAKANMSAAQKGKHLSEETKRKMSIANRGKVLSEETRAKISAAKVGKPSPTKGRHHSGEARLKIAAARRGQHRSKETAAKISIANKGRTPWNKGKQYPGRFSDRKRSCPSEETKAKISATMKKIRARRSNVRVQTTNSL